MLFSSVQEQRINVVIAKRHALAKKFDTKLKLLGSLKTVIDTMDQRRDDVLNATKNDKIKYKLGGIDLDGIRNTLYIEEQKIRSYYAIFSKKTVNIGVIGLARQGKSQLLRSLSGLDETIVPTGPYGHCTGAKSVFINDGSAEPHSEIYFYNESEFLNEIIAPYYNNLFEAVASPDTLQEFGDKPLPLLPAHKQKSVTDKVKYSQLELYKNKLESYKKWLVTPSPLVIPVDQVREFVAQDDVHGERQLVNAMAVKEARINCRFPQETMTDVALIDMPGLGDTGLVTEKWLTKSLIDDIDVILFVKKPSGLGEVWKPQELALYDTIKNAQPEIAMELRSLLVMNRVHSSSPNEDNVKNCERLTKEVVDQMKFGEVLVTDCANPDEVNEVLFQTILSHITKNVDQINQALVTNVNSAFKRIYDQIKTELAKADDIVGVNESSAFNFNNFNRLFRDTIRRVYSSLEQLNNDLKRQRDVSDQSFEKYVTESKRSAYTNSGIPDLEKIEETRNVFGGYKSACEYYLNHIRTHLTQHFEHLEEGMAESVESIKAQLASSLISIEKGNLSNISLGSGSEFLKDMSILLGEQYPVLDPAFKILLNFNLSYQSFFYYRLRKHLDYLTPDMGMAELSAKPSAQEIYDLLTAMHKIALERIESEVSYWSVEINHAIFATVEQFVDKVLRSENAMDEWQSFYIDNRSKIWPESFPEIYIDSSLRWQWTDVIERLRALNKAIIEN